MINNIEFFITCAILLIVFSTAILLYAKKIMSVSTRQNDELNRLMFSVIRKTQNLDDALYALKEQNQMYENEIKRLQEMINSLGVLSNKNASSIASLTSSINNVIQENKRCLENKIYPTPQLSDMIRTTIGEFLRQEIVLIRDMRFPVSPNDPVVTKITRNTILTYPHVDEGWIAKKVIEVIQEAVRE